MAKKKIQRKDLKDGQKLGQLSRGKADLVSDRPEQYELSEELTKRNPSKTQPDNQGKKKK